MMEYRESGLPMNQPEVFKAFAAWRLNAKDFAKFSGMDEKYPLDVAQLINDVNPKYTELMKLALLTTVPAAAWSVVEKRFGAETVEKLEEMWKHAMTGYTYADEASNEVKGLAMVAAIKAFDNFMGTSANVNSTFSLEELGVSPREMVEKLEAPECKLFERLADRLTGTSYPELEQLYAEKLAAYRDARREQVEELAQMGMDFDDNDAEALQIPFEMQGLADAPEVRKAYDILTHDSRVSLMNLANALSVGRLLSELSDVKDPTAIAAGMLDTGLTHMKNEDAEFLAKRLPADVMQILDDYDIERAVTRSAETLREAPPSVRQIAVAKGLVMLDMARQQSEKVFEYIDMKADALPPGMDKEMKAETIEPLEMLAAVVPKALAPILNRSGSRMLDQLFDAQVKDTRAFVARHSQPSAIPNLGRNGPKRAFGL